MAVAALEPYTAYKLYEPDDPRFTVRLIGLRNGHGLSRHFLKCITCEWRLKLTGEPFITFNHEAVTSLCTAQTSNPR